MAMSTIPLAMPADLLDEVKRTAEQTDLSSADIMRQAIKAGLPQVQKALALKSPLGGLKPLTKEESEQCWGKTEPDDPHRKEFDALSAHCAGLPVPPEEE